MDLFSKLSGSSGSSAGGDDAKYKTMFSALDKDKSGKIDKSDLAKILPSSVPQNTVDMVVGFVDKGGDGKIDFNEFKNALKKFGI